MGSMQAGEFADAVADGTVGLDAALTWHLTSNHYPPISLDFIPIAKRAIKLANKGRWNQPINMPNGLTRSVETIIEGMHLDSFLEAAEF